MKETINLLVLFVIKSAMTINNLFTAHSVITGYIADVMAHQKLNLTSYLMNLMTYHFTVFYALFIIMQRVIHLVIYQHLKSVKLIVDIPSQLSMLPSYTVCSKLTKLPNLDNFDMDKNLIHAVDSRYVRIPELNELTPTKQSFSLFHMNVRSLSAHHDELLVLLG